MACWKTLGISSGRFKIDRVTPVMKYHVFDGRCGYVLRDCRRDGVMMDGSVAEDILNWLDGFRELLRLHRGTSRVCAQSLLEKIADSMICRLDISFG